MIRSASLLLLLAAAAPAFGQSNVATDNKFCWSENAGYLNWRDAGSPAASQGAVIAGTFLTGFVWGENTGWINLGTAPANGIAFHNTTGADFGVNLDPNSGALSGLAWGENIGWINFTLPALPASQLPRLDKNTNRLRGYAWSENIGWINLDSDDTGKYVAIVTPPPSCAADYNRDGVLNPDDLSDYITDYFTQPPPAQADFNADGVINPDDLSDYITAYFDGCP